MTKYKIPRALVLFLLLMICNSALGQNSNGNRRSYLDRQLAEALQAHGFTGRVEESPEASLDRPLNAEVADLGRNLFFDKILSLQGDNACAGCHAPSRGFGDTQPIAIGIDNNNVVGNKRSGPRNQRRTRWS